MFILCINPRQCSFKVSALCVLTIHFVNMFINASFVVPHPAIHDNTNVIFVCFWSWWMFQHVIIFNFWIGKWNAWFHFTTKTITSGFSITSNTPTQRSFYHWTINWRIINLLGFCGATKKDSAIFLSLCPLSANRLIG